MNFTGTLNHITASIAHDEYVSDQTFAVNIVFFSIEGDEDWGTRRIHIMLYLVGG